nr:hypothetical protein GCM10010200_094900 [Actinomadura rugatobispora]
MAAQAGRPVVERAALERAFGVWLAAVIVAGGTWLGMLLIADRIDALIAAVGGLAALIVSLAVAVAAYHVQYARGLRTWVSHRESDDDRLERRLRELVDGPLPDLIGRLRAGASPQETLADLKAVPDHLLGRLVHVVAEGVASGERDAAVARGELESLDRAVVRLAEETLPALVERIHGDRASASTALAELPALPHASLDRLLRETAEALVVSERTRAAAMAAAASAAARIQAQTTRMLAQLRELEDRYNEDEFFGDLLDLDHHVSQMGRLADSIALLSGGRSGRRWTKPIVLESIIRGAMGRIASYQRVQYHSTSNAAVAGFAAEGVMHALAELMDNAANFSPHGTAVHVYAEEEDAGVVVTIEDSGLGMRQRERERAERLVAEAADLTTLPGTRLGLAVVGRLAGKHRLTVSFRPSSRGGIGVVVLIPRRLITRASDETALDMPPGVGTAASSATSSPSRARAAVRTGADDAHLPKRRRGATLAATIEQPPRPAPKPRDPGVRFAAFRQSAEGRTRAGGTHDDSDGTSAADLDQ